MELARDLAGLSTDLNGLSNQNAGNNSKAELMESKHRALSSKKERDSSVRDPDLLKRHLQNVELKPNNHEDIKPGEPDDESQILTDLTCGSNMLSLVCEENAVLKPEQNEAMVTQHEEKDENSQ
ncbi:hypothetical protein Peur_047364 [Populus x canadensis]